MGKIDFESLFETLPERYVVIDVIKPGYTMIAASKAYLSITDKKADQIIGQPLFTVFPDTSEEAMKTGKGDLHHSFENVIATLKADSTGVIRYDLADKKGNLEVRYWQATHYPVIQDDKLVAILQSTADITQLVLSEEQLKLANLKLEDALSSGLIGSWSWNITKDIVTADKGLSKIFGVSVEAALKGLPISNFIDSIYEDDRAMVAEKIEESVTSKDFFECEYRTIDTNGLIRWVIARGRIERDEDGKAVEFPGVMIDISSRKEAEAILRDSEERLRFMADTMPQLVWITRPDGYHEYYNKHWYEYTGTKEGETDGKRWNNLFHKEDRVRAKQVWQHSLDTGEPYEIRYRLFNVQTDRYRWVIGRALPYKDENGTILKWYGTCTDIDDSIREIEERKKLEKELKDEKIRLESRVAERTSQLKLTNEGLRDEIKKRLSVEKKLREYGEELKRSNKELEEFAYVSSHDLQEPLRKIRAFGDLLVEEYANKLGDGKEYLDRISSSAARMSTLIEDLLTFSRVTTKPAVPKPINLNEILESTVSDLHDRIEKEKGVVDIQSDLPTVKADETHMRQLFQNLISNALKFHQPEVAPFVRISASVDEDEYTITVTDNGIGIDPKYADKIFAVFQRLNSKYAYEGTGIGLAVCKKIVERYGGTIQVKSQVGVGTSFIITLPLEYEE
jgi:PAS domain S-box-containing protein